MSQSDTSGYPFVIEYEPTKSSQRYQDYLPRFGHTDNVTKVYEEQSRSETTDYMVGLIFVGCVILAVFLIWSVFLLVSMCMGQNAGFLSGAAFSRKIEPKRDDSIREYEESVGDNEIPLPQTPEERFSGRYASHSSFVAGVQTFSEEKPYRIGDPLGSRPTRSRIVFIVSGVVCITFGILMVTQGITDLQTTINTIDRTTSELSELTNSAQILVQKGLIDRFIMATNLRNIIEQQLKDEVFCPRDPTLSDSDVARQIRDAKNEVLASIRQLDDFRISEIEDFEDAMGILHSTTSDVAEQVDSIHVNDWEALVVLIPYTIFPSFLIIAALFAFHDLPVGRYSCFINWFVLPIFILMTTVAFGVAAAMSIAAGINSDFCLPGGEDDSSPDDLILSIMKAEGHDENSFPYKVAKFYVEQCGTDDPLMDIRQYRPDLMSSENATKALASNFLNETMMSELAVYCNRDYDIFEPLLESLSTVVDAFAQSVASTLDLAQCGRMIPLYTDSVYEAGCQYAPSAVFWIYSCSLVLALFGMIMITLRSSMKVTVVEHDYKNHFLESFKAMQYQDDPYQATQYQDEHDDIVEAPPSPQFSANAPEEEYDDYVDEDRVPTEISTHKNDEVIDMPNEPGYEIPLKEQGQ